MASVPIEEGLISVREYLRTSYSPDREYVMGGLWNATWAKRNIPYFTNTSFRSSVFMKRIGAW